MTRIDPTPKQTKTGGFIHGIKYIGANSAANEDEDNALSRNKGIESINTPLFNNADPFDANKLNSLVRLNFSGALSDIPEILKPFAKQICLVDMLDFDAVTFDKQFKTSATSKVEITSKFPLVKLEDICEIVAGQSPESRYYNNVNNGLPTESYKSITNCKA